MLSPRTGLGLEAEKTGLGLGLGLDDSGLGLGLGLETLRPRPRVVWPRGLVYCNVLFHDLTHCQFQLNIGNCYCKVSYHENRVGPYRGLPHSIIIIAYLLCLSSICAFIVNPLWPRPRPWPRPRTLLASLTSLDIGLYKVVYMSLRLPPKYMILNELCLLYTSDAADE